MSPLIDVHDLRALLAAGGDVVVLDVRWARDADDPRSEHVKGHIPGSRFVDLETELSGPSDPAAGRHPLPAPDTFAATAAGWGVGPETHVVAYDDSGGLSAARLWWLLRWIGHRRVQVLDGGLAAWQAAGGEVVAGTDPPARPAAAPLPVRPGSMATVTPEDIVAGRAGVLLDARDAERFRGEVEPIDPVAGRIPGARSVPTAGNLAADGTFLDAATLRSRFEAAGVVEGRPVATYCGSGVTAAHLLLALEVAGLGEPAALYAPSWSGWISDPAHPVERG